MRRETIAVQIGEVVLSSEQPVLVQSMLNTSTLDTEACVEQSIRIIEAGGQLVRITAPGVKEAENLKNIRDILRERSYTVPLSADIHFSPAAALVAARYVEKVRINPGNFVDKRATFQNLVYTEEEYAAELQQLKCKFTEFLDECRRHHIGCTYRDKSRFFIRSDYEPVWKYACRNGGGHYGIFEDLSGNRF